MKKHLLLIIVALFALGCENPPPQSSPQITSVTVYSTSDGDNYIEWEKDYYTGNTLAESDKETSAQIEIRGIDLAADNYTSATEVKIINSSGQNSTSYTYSMRTEDTIRCTVHLWATGKFYVVLRKGGEDGEWTAINEEHYIMVY